MYAVTVIDAAGEVVHTDECPDMNAAKRSANGSVGSYYSLGKVLQHDARVLDMQIESPKGIFHVLIQSIGGLQDDFSDIVAGWDNAS